MTSRFLLDANLSPRIARHLSRTLGLDVTSLQGQRLGELDDTAVRALANARRRVIITLDRDFVALFEDASEAHRVGTIYLNLSKRYRYVPEIARPLAEFFREFWDAIDFGQSLVIITDGEVTVHQTQSRN